MGKERRVGGQKLVGRPAFLIFISRMAWELGSPSIHLMFTLGEHYINNTPFNHRRTGIFASRGGGGEGAGKCRMPKSSNLIG